MRIEYAEQENIAVEVESPGVDPLDDGESDVLVLAGENITLRVEGDLDAFVHRINEAVKAQGWAGV